MSDDTLAIAADAAEQAVRQHRAQGPVGLLAKVDKTTATALLACVAALTTQADRWVAGMVHDDQTAIARAVDARIELRAGELCEAQVSELRGEVEDAAATPPTIADLADKQRDDRARIYVLERILDVGEYQRNRER
jgi:hypothetical protein